MVNKRITPKVSVLIGTYNGREWLKANILSLLSQKIDLEIILVDDCSTDGTSTYLRTAFPQVTLLRNNKRQGYAYSINKAARIARGKYLFIENADMRMSRNYLRALSAYLDTHPNIAAVQGTIYDYDYETKPQAAGLLFNPMGLIISLLKYHNSIPDNERYIFSSDAFLVRKKVFMSLRGFNPDYQMYFEEYDFCWRLWLYGYRFVLIPKSKMYHAMGGSIKKFSSSRVYYFAFRNSLYVPLVYLEKKNAIIAISVKAVQSACSAAIFAVKGQLAYIAELMRAWSFVAIQSQNLITRRKFAQSHRKLSDSQLFSLVGARLTVGYIKKILFGS